MSLCVMVIPSTDNGRFGSWWLADIIPKYRLGHILAAYCCNSHSIVQALLPSVCSWAPHYKSRVQVEVQKSRNYNK